MRAFLTFSSLSLAFASCCAPDGWRLQLRHCVLSPGWLAGPTADGVGGRPPLTAPLWMYYYNIFIVVVVVVVVVVVAIIVCFFLFRQRVALPDWIRLNRIAMRIWWNETDDGFDSDWKWCDDIFDWNIIFFYINLFFFFSFGNISCIKGNVAGGCPRIKRKTAESNRSNPINLINPSNL